MVQTNAMIAVTDEHSEELIKAIQEINKQLAAQRGPVKRVDSDWGGGADLDRWVIERIKRLYSQGGWGTVRSYRGIGQYTAFIFYPQGCKTPDEVDQQAREWFLMGVAVIALALFFILVPSVTAIVDLLREW